MGNLFYESIQEVANVGDMAIDLAERALSSYSG